MGKRKAETIDLTDDGHDTAVGKKKQSKSSASSLASQDQPQYITPPSSSQLSGGGNVHESFPPSSQGASHGRVETSDGNWGASTQQIEDDIRREIDLTQDSDDEDTYENYQLYGILNTKIVGIRYYNGRATVGEYVVVKREPANQYDRNAIRIDNVIREQIGHIGRNVAAKLAPFIDSGELKIEGALTGEKGVYDCPIGLKLFGTSDVAGMAALKEKMQEAKLPVSELIKSEKESVRRAKEMEKQQKAREKAAAAMRKNGAAVFDPEGPNRYSNLNAQTGTGDDPGQALHELLSSTATYNPREVQNVVNKFGAGEDVLSKMEMADQPETLATVLLPYQRQGLRWMLEHESPKLPERGSDDIVQLWKNSQGIYSNIATSFSVTKAPELASGGILADDMGLGKTIQVISLIMADPKKNQLPTLIVAPLSVMSNWTTQAAQHVKKKFAPRTLIYHGQDNRGLTPEQFKEYDIVVTTYQTMTIELFPYGKDKPVEVPASKGLFSIEWRRVVLDEGHQIRNPKAKMSRAACTLLAQSRWVLTGTPIVNSLKDLYSHVKFLRLSGGFAEFEIFNGTLIRPLKYGNPEARVLLQALMATLCLRRMKDMKFIDLKLPGITFHKYTVKFQPHEQERYDAFKAEAKGLVEAAKAKKGDNTMTHLLEVLLRLRQTCNHWKMCGEERVQRLLSLVEENKAVDVMNPENRKTLQDLLQLKIDNQEECPVCMDVMTTPAITACAHAFCKDCITKVIETQHKCPMCRTRLDDPTNLVEPIFNFGESTSTLPSSPEDSTTSSKIQSLISILLASSKESPKTKTVIFSQWTSFLDLLQPHLQSNSLPFTRLDGTLPPSARDAALTPLSTSSEVNILLASLSVCSVGLNLTCANTVILSDSWWAPAIEDQAVDRVHRLGQTKECKVIRLVVKGTFEEEVLEIQAKKRKLVGEAFGDGGSGGRRRRGETREERLMDIGRLIG